MLLTIFVMLVSRAASATFGAVLYRFGHGRRDRPFTAADLDGVATRAS